MTTVDEQLVFRVVSRFVSEKYGLTTREFEAFLLDRGAGLYELETEVFAELRDRSKASSVRFEPFEVTYGEWEMNVEFEATLGLDAKVEVTESEPVFEEIEFTVANLEDVTESEDSEPEVSPNPKMLSGVEMVEFDYTIVTLNPDGSERERYPAKTTGFTEVLAKSGLGALRERGLRTNLAQLIRPIELDMLAIPGGEFLMGASDNEGDYDRERPQHLVSVPPFYLGRVPVTQLQWQFIAGLRKVDRDLKANPSRFKGYNLPVEQVSWNDAVEFCARLSRHTGRAYRLPTEAEWEYACRAGTTTPFHFCETLNTDIANYNGNSTYGDGQKGQYRQKTTPVGSLDAANAWGLLDMHGNVWEWCEDDWHSSYDDAPTDGNAWLDSEISTENVDENRTKVLRGGSWDDIPRDCRSAARFCYSRDYRSFDLDFGFRVACAAPRLS
jgi:formylglycine-generating enzyme required for sulfatase activity